MPPVWHVVAVTEHSITIQTQSGSRLKFRRPGGSSGVMYARFEQGYRRLSRGSSYWQPGD